MFSKSMSEPIQDRRELDEGEKSNGKFFEMGADATMAFDEAEEGFDFVPAPIVASMEAAGQRRKLLGAMQTRVFKHSNRARRLSASKPLSPTTHRCRKQPIRGSTAKTSLRCPSANPSATARPPRSTMAQT